MKKFVSWIVAHLTILYIIISIIGASVLILLLFPRNDRATRYNYSVGSFWTENDLFAPYDFIVSRDEGEQQSAIDLAKQQALLYYVPDSTAFSRARQLLTKSHLDRRQQQSALHVLQNIYRKGYMEQPTDYESTKGHTIILIHGNIGEEHSPGDYVSQQQVYDYVLDRFDASEAPGIERLLVDSILQYSVCYDATRSQLELDSRLSQSDVTSTMIQRGELVVSKGEYVDQEKAHVLATLEKENAKYYVEHYNVFNHELGNLLLCFIAFTVLFLYLKNTKHEILEDQRKITLMLVVVLLMAAIVALIQRINPSWVLLAPLCIAPILMHVFFDMRVALYVHLTIVIILGNLVPNSFEFIFYQIATGMMSIITVREFEKRSSFFTVSAVIFITYSLIYTAGKLGQDTTLQNLRLESYVIFFLNAALTLLSYPLIYLFEKVFRLTTDLTLLEISSTDTPALRALSRKAPGTFQHCMQVANLSEDVVNEIGGDALLARVGGLYHDIGKIMAPIYFTENQNANFNPHNNIGYKESARIITQHVLDGISLAKKFHLPTEVVDFIRTHHGTTHTGYFYAKWCQEHPDDTPDEEAFTYSGPKPFSRETAVVMIVDSVEAAGRSLRNPDKESISNLVDSIIDSKIAEDQLSNCNITFSDITHIREVLKIKMMSIYHVRIAYPVVK